MAEPTLISAGALLPSQVFDDALLCSAILCV
jgi:hypothetical protein